MRISYSDWWDDMVAIARANASILFAIAAAFVFLPTLAASFFTKPLEAAAKGALPAEIIARYAQYFSDNWAPQLVVLLLSTLGQLLLYIVLLDARRPVVADAFRMAASLFLPFFALNILVGLILLGGAFLFIIPALYLVGRVMLSPAASVAERRTNPLAALGRSFALTAGKGWRIFFFVFLILLVVTVTQLAVQGIVAVAFAVVGDGVLTGIGKLLVSASISLFAAVSFVLSVLLWVALYRKLAGGSGASSAT